jgi:autotransporter-associated beta strand protein
VTLTGKYLSASSVTVSGTKVYTFAAASTGSFAGPGKLIYNGANQFTLGNVNTHTGGTIISNATAYLLLQNYGGLGAGPVTLAKAGGQMEIAPGGSASVGINGDINVADDFAIQFDTPGTFSGVLLGNLSGTAGKVLTLNVNATNTTANQRIRVYGASTVYNADLVLNSPLISFAPYLANGSQIYNGVISGPGGIIQRGSGVAVFSGQNTYSGGTIPSNGSIGFGADSTPTVGTVTSGPIGTSPLFIIPELPNTTGSGAILAWGGARTIANPLQYPSATNNQTLVLGGTNALTLSGPFTLNGNDATGTLTNRILQGDNTNVTTFSGVISDGGLGFGIIKTGSGILALSNTETYTGPTTISNGTLRVNGSLNAGSIVTVATNGTLGGTGTINGPVTVQAFGSIAPGASIGTLTINNSLALAGNLRIEVNRAGLLSDQTVVSGTLANTGTGRVTVSNLGAALVAGDKFFLFNKAVTSGNAMTVTGAGAYWQNDLALDGSITVHSLPVITSAVPGVNNITLSGTNGIAGGTYYVLASTNVAAALTNWTTIQTNTFGAGGTFTTPVIPVTAGTPTRFFMLQLP